MAATATSPQRPQAQARLPPSALPPSAPADRQPYKPPALQTASPTGVCARYAARAIERIDGHYCRSDIVAAGLTLVLTQLDRQNVNIDYDAWVAAAASARIIDADQNAILTAIIILSMVLTPLAIAGLNLVRRRAQPSAEGLPRPEGLTGVALVIGFGRVGQIASQYLFARGARQELRRLRRLGDGTPPR